MILQVEFFNKNTTTYYDECPLEGHLIVKDLLIVCFAIAVLCKSTNFAKEVKSASNFDTRQATSLKWEYTQNYRVQRGRTYFSTQKVKKSSPSAEEFNE